MRRQGRQGWGGAFRRLTLALALALGAPSGGAVAQDSAAPRIAVVVLDREALYAGSLFGQRIRREMEAASQALSMENRRIEASLVAEEQSLTDQRATMDVAAFRVLANEFDIRVEEIRSAQEIKGRALTQQAEQASQMFFQIAGPILTDLAQRSGALVVLDRRTVLAAADQVDITARAIAEVNEVVGEGPGLDAMLEGRVQVPTQRPEGLSRPPGPAPISDPGAAPETGTGVND